MDKELTVDDLKSEPTVAADNLAQEPAGDDVDNQGKTSPTQSADPDESRTTADDGRVQFYKPEEMRELKLEELNSARIPPEMKPWYDSMRAAQTKSSQELAAQRKQFQEQQQQFQEWQKQNQSQQDPREAAYKAYLQNPQNFLDALHQQIDSLEAIDPLDEAKYHEARKTIRSLEKMKDQFVLRAQQEAEYYRNLSRIEAQTNVEILKDVPDYEKKAPKLRKFAETELKVSSNLVDLLLNPKIFGKHTPEIVRAVNIMYDIVNVGNKIKGKDNPNRLEAPGSGFHENNEAKMNVILDGLKKSTSTDNIAQVLSKRRQLLQKQKGG